MASTWPQHGLSMASAWPQHGLSMARLAAPHESTHTEMSTAGLTFGLSHHWLSLEWGGHEPSAPTAARQSLMSSLQSVQLLHAPPSSHRPGLQLEL